MPLAAWGAAATARTASAIRALDAHHKDEDGAKAADTLKRFVLSYLDASEAGMEGLMPKRGLSSEHRAAIACILPLRFSTLIACTLEAAGRPENRRITRSTSLWQLAARCGRRIMPLEQHRSRPKRLASIGNVNLALQCKK